ncbi:MAG: DNA recombination protein RmuC [Parcubacteria group bacterium]|nr:DNA recombination protein RmuC [Parcubacteria group bacterium]
MNTAFIISISIVGGIALGGLVIWLIIRAHMRREKEDNGKNDQSFIMLQNQMGELARTLDQKLGESSRSMHDAVRVQFSESQKLIRDITEQITHVKETNRQVISVADQLKSLQNTLQNPKQRGVLGEYYLDTVLKNVLPPEHYKLQYGFANGDIVDAVIFFDRARTAKLLPIDSKFSLENYNRLIEESPGPERDRVEKLFVQDIKNRIDETSKYIRPKEGTLDYAFMFIPSEAIYYDLLVNKVGAIKSSTRDLIEYAFGKHVIITSPTSFMAYLQTVLQGLRALQIEESAKEIRTHVEELGRHIGAYEQFMQKLGNSLGTTVNHYNTAHKELKKIDKDVMRITGAKDSIGIEPVVLEKPLVEEE